MELNKIKYVLKYIIFFIVGIIVSAFIIWLLQYVFIELSSNDYVYTNIPVNSDYYELKIFYNILYFLAWASLLTAIITCLIYWGVYVCDYMKTFKL